MKDSITVRLLSEITLKEYALVNNNIVDVTKIYVRKTKTIGLGTDIVIAVPEEIGGKLVNVSNLVYVKSLMDIVVILGYEHIADNSEVQSILASSYTEDGKKIHYAFSLGKNGTRLITFGNFCKAINVASGIYKTGRMAGFPKHSKETMDKLYHVKKIWEQEIMAYEFKRRRGI